MAEKQIIVPPTSNGVSVPAFEQKIKLNTLQAQKVMKRVFSRAAGSLYRIDVILRIIGSDQDAERVELVIHTMLKEVEEALRETEVEMASMLEENGIDALPVYDAPTEESVRITSPHVARFVSLVRKLDALIAQIDALWLSGLMTNKDRNDAVYRWQQRIIGLGSRIIGLERRARQAAKRQGKSEEVDAQAPDELQTKGEELETAQPANDSQAISESLEPSDDTQSVSEPKKVEAIV
ncbi:MAG: hypothetical protein GX771_07730 [Halomonadaceae bacterium]|nr:hypothetical protein [Halomonadaceae bacterium]